MVETVPGSNWQSMQNYLSESPWDPFAVMDQIGKDSDAIIGNDPDSCLIVDESGITKRGKKSVGVARQWNGRLGKVDNCQVGVFVALNCRERVTLTDTRLFLPKEWTNSPKRCQQAGVPKDRCQHRKKTELALEMIEAARRRGSSHRWISADAFYGDDSSFLRQLDQLAETFVVDVHNDQHIYAADPKPSVPPRDSNRGPQPSRFKPSLRSEAVKDWVAKQPADAWKRVVVRDSTTGPIEVEVLHGRVWLWDGKEPQAHHWHLIVRREINSKNKVKYSLSNATADTTIERLVFMQGQRYFVERGLEDAKSTVGLAEYQVRGWTGWHHHMAMVMLAMLFLLKTRIKYADTYELLSCNDIRELLIHFLPKRAVTSEEVFRQMHIRHQKRKYSMQFYRNQKLKKSD